MTSFLERFFNIRREELASVLAAATFFFFVLTAGQMIRPARDALGMQRGIEDVVWLFQGTLIITLLVNPVFGWLVSRFRRMVFISATYLFFAASLLGFYYLLVTSPQAVGERVGQVFYVWFSVFTFFATMVFWALMADRFSLEQSKRVFPTIAVGGTLGAIAGPTLAGVLAEPLGTPFLLVAGVVCLVLAVIAALVVARLQPEQARGPEESPVDQVVIGGSAWEGIRAVFQSRYLLGISGYFLVVGIMATFIYFTRLNMVAALGDDLDMRTTVFANIDRNVQLVTLATQLVITGQLMKRFGVPIAMILLPMTAALGFVGLAMTGTFAAFIVLDASFRAVQRGIMRPARETLFTTVTREEKYKAKAFTDTFVYRAGDSVGAWTQAGLAALGMGLVALASIALPLAAAWGMLGLWLGRKQERDVAARHARGDSPERQPAGIG